VVQLDTFIVGPRSLTGDMSNRDVDYRSEGPQPHMIDLSFPKRVFVSVSLELAVSSGSREVEQPVCPCMLWRRDANRAGSTCFLLVLPTLSPVTDHRPSCCS